MSLFSKAIKSVSNPVKKVVSTAVQTAAGFAAGGNVGGLAGLTRGIYENTKTGNAETINARTVGQGFVTGGAANLAAGAVAGGFHFLSGAAANGGLMTKAVAFGKSGGVVGNAGNIFKGLGGLVSKGLPVFAGLFNRGVVPGTTETPQSVSDGQSSLADNVRSAYRKFKPEITDNMGDLSTLANDIRSNGLGNALRDKTTEIFTPQPVPQVTGPGGSPTVINGPTQDSQTPLLLAGAGLLAFFLFKKK